MAALLATFVTGTTLVSLAADPPAEKAGDAIENSRRVGRSEAPAD